MVELLSVFFVLTTGSKPIELAVTPPVVRVEALPDGREITTWMSFTEDGDTGDSP